jgi:hypothetical protein
VNLVLGGTNKYSLIYSRRGGSGKVYLVRGGSIKAFFIEGSRKIPVLILFYRSGKNSISFQKTAES